MACKTITVRKRAGKQYLIHYAGGAAFVVRVFGKVLTVYTSKYSNSSDIAAGKQVYRTNIKKLFVPSSLKPGVRLPKRTLSGSRTDFNRGCDGTPVGVWTNKGTRPS